MSISRNHLWFANLAALLVLAGCGGDSGNSAVLPPGHGGASGTAVAPQPASGENCNGIYGNHPFPTATSLQGLMASLYPVELTCPLKGGEHLTWEDAMGTPREACLQVPAHASEESPLPLITLLGGSILPGDPQTLIIGFDSDFQTADLTGDASRPGFILLMVEGRDKGHHYPFPDDHAWGFDNWYRNFDRNDPGMNVDAATIDHFIEVVESRGIVDPNRRYMSGISNGAAMAMLYALNTRGIAASAIYSNPDPFSDVDDPCAQTPFGNNLRPIMTIHNDCDVIGICTTGSEQLSAKMSRFLPKVEYRPVIVNIQGNEIDACDARCDYNSDGPTGWLSIGTARHALWPQAWNEEMFSFLRERPLSQ